MRSGASDHRLEHEDHAQHGSEQEREHDLLRDDRQCRPLGKFTAHLEKIENQTSAGERIPMADILETAVAGDVWLTAINEAPVFVEGAVDAAK